MFQRAGLPVEIIAEFETWRRIRDAEGAEGWVLHSLLSGTAHRARGAMVEAGPAAAARQAGREGRAWWRSCSPACWAREDAAAAWCRHHRQPDFDGWIQQDKLWGVYPNEKVD